MALYSPRHVLHGLDPNPKCILLGACECGQQCLSCGWSQCICSAKWCKASWPHSKDYDAAQLELVQRFRQCDRFVNKCVELTLSQFSTVKQLRGWIWYVMDFRRSAELAWAQRTMHRGPAVRWMGFQGVKLGIAALGDKASWYEHYTRKWPCSVNIRSRATYTLEAWKGDIDPRAWQYSATNFPSKGMFPKGTCR